ncbi:hypothetical protein [Paracoccus simplex]|uniref:Lipoprotein n=1 Tax=Paracoccus simplex TaxID=2086346 RepID=A0ABV7S1Y9_9RHOB
MTRKSLLIFAPLLALAGLAGCRDERGEGPMTPGIYSVVTVDGSQNRTIFKEDGTFVDMEDNNPKPVAEGKWWRKDGKLCVQPTDAAEPLCAEEKPLGDDGGFLLTANGVTLEFKALVQ